MAFLCFHFSEDVSQKYFTKVCCTYCLEIHCNLLSFLTPFLELFCSPLSCLLGVFHFSFLLNFIQLLVVSVQVLTRTKLKISDFFHFKIRSTNVKLSLQNYKVSKCKLIHKNSCQLWHQNGILRISLIKRSCLTSPQPIRIGWQMHFQPVHFPFVPQKGVFYRGQFVIWPRIYLIIM